MPSCFSYLLSPFCATQVFDLTNSRISLDHLLIFVSSYVFNRILVVNKVSIYLFIRVGRRAAALLCCLL